MISSSLLVTLDKTCEYIPIISSFANLAILWQKYSPSSTISSPFRRYVEEKPTTRCLWLLVPFVGNFLIYQDDAKVFTIKQLLLETGSAASSYLPSCMVSLQTLSATSSEWQKTFCTLEEHIQFFQKHHLVVEKDPHLQQKLSTLIAYKEEISSLWESVFMQNASKEEKKIRLLILAYTSFLTSYLPGSSLTVWDTFRSSLLKQRKLMFEKTTSHPYLIKLLNEIEEKENALYTLRSQDYLLSFKEKSREQQLELLLDPLLINRFSFLSLLQQDETFLAFLQQANPTKTLTIKDISLETKLLFIQNTTIELKKIKNHPFEYLELESFTSLL